MKFVLTGPVSSRLNARPFYGGRWRKHHYHRAPCDLASGVESPRLHEERTHPDAALGLWLEFRRVVLNP